MGAPWIDELVAELDLTAAIRSVCWPCLSFVSLPLAHGEEKVARREARKMAPVLWDEGLARPALASVAEAHARGIPHAAEALAELEARRGRSAVTIAIVLRLAADLERWSKKVDSALRN